MNLARKPRYGGRRQREAGTLSLFQFILPSILCISFFLLSFLSTTAADTSGDLVTRLRRQEEAKKKQADSDPKGGVADLDTAQKELEGLNNTVSNAMFIAEETKHAEETDRGVFTSVVIATLLLGGGIYLVRKFNPRIAFLYNVPSEENEGTEINSAEKKSFSAFATAFKVGPTPVSSSSSEFTLNESLRTAEFRSVTISPLKVFFDGAPKAIALMRSLIQEITRSSEQAARQKLLFNLGEKMRELKGMAGLPEVLPVWQLAAALEGLVRQLSDKDRNVTPSSLRTVASAVDLLDALSVAGVRSDLLSEPPVRFLAVDDDSLSRHAVSFALKKALNKPDLAENGEAALALVSAIKYDAVFLDIQMPGMNGFEVCSKIHRTELNQATPVVFVTCMSDFDARAKSTLSGGTDLIGKPFLTFEITVKALTLVLRARLKPTTAVTRQEAAKATETLPSLSREIVTPLVVEKEMITADGRNTTEADEANSAEFQSPAHKSRVERRRDRRKIAQTRQSKKSGRHGKRQDGPKNDSMNISPDVVANAFLAHAPANIEMLHDRIEHIYEATDEAFRQEILVELYLAVHSLTSEANLAKLQTFFQLSSAIEVLLRQLVEEPSDSVISSLSIVAGTLELLHEFCDAKLTAHLGEKQFDFLIVADDPAARKDLQNAIQLLPARLQTADTKQAADLLNQNHFDTIFFDVQSPSVDAFSTCSSLRDRSKSKPSLVFVCNGADSEVLLESIQAGGRDRLIHRTSSSAEIRLAALTSVLSFRFDQLGYDSDSQYRVEDAASEK